MVIILMPEFFVGFTGLRAVTAAVPGYKSKTTWIWLEEAGTTNGDFDLDPEVNPRGINFKCL